MLSGAHVLQSNAKHLLKLLCEQNIARDIKINEAKSVTPKSSSEADGAGRVWHRKDHTRDMPSFIYFFF